VIGAVVVVSLAYIAVLIASDLLELVLDPRLRTRRVVRRAPELDTVA
jgi:peptide/nickel transport system permease protein